MINQMDLVTGILTLLDKMGVKDGNSRQFNAVIKAANLIVEEFGKPTVKASDGMGLQAWLESDDTGQSSLAMARRLCDVMVPTSPEEIMTNIPPHPQDPDDFGRCYRFLRAVPIGDNDDSRRHELSRMASASPVWAKLIENWRELECLYEEESPTGRGPKLYERMQQLIKEGENATDRGEKQGN